MKPDAVSGPVIRVKEAFSSNEVVSHGMKFEPLARSREGPALRSSPQIRRAYGKQPLRRPGHSNTEESHSRPATGRFGQDFTRLPLVSRSQPQRRPGSPYDAPGAQHRFDDLEGDAEPLGSGSTKCPEFVSLTAKGKDPELKTFKGRCRFRLGTCTTRRGTCGNTADSGMAFEGKVKTAAGCTGKLAFMQNVLSTDRKVTLADGTQECISVSSAHHDGGPPWKNCSVPVTTAGITTTPGT
jgi:hypothetical protein